MKNISDINKKICRFWINVFKKTALLSAVSLRLVQITGKHDQQIHPKHLIQIRKPWYLQYITKESVVLDIGCQNGQNTLKAAKKCKYIHGFDTNNNNLLLAVKEAKGKQIKNCRFYTGSAENNSSYIQKYDVIMLLDVLEHLNNRNRVLKNIYYSLRSKGKLLLSIPNSESSWKKTQRKFDINSFSDPDHKIEYSQKSIVTLLNRRKFKVLQILPSVLDTPFVGFIDLLGGISLTLYKKFVIRRRRQAILKPQESVGWEITCIKI